MPPASPSVGDTVTWLSKQRDSRWSRFAESINGPRQGHGGDPATLSNADEDRLLAPVLPSDDDETDELDPYLADLDRCFDRWKDSRTAA